MRIRLCRRAWPGGGTGPGLCRWRRRHLRLRRGVRRRIAGGVRWRGWLGTGRGWTVVMLVVVLVVLVGALLRGGLCWPAWASTG